MLPTAPPTPAPVPTTVPTSATPSPTETQTAPPTDMTTTDTSAVPNANSSNSMLIPIVVGVVCGVICLIITFTVIGCVLYRRKNRQYTLQENTPLKNSNKKALKNRPTDLEDVAPAAPERRDSKKALYSDVGTADDENPKHRKQMEVTKD